MWVRNWAHVEQLFQYGSAIRKVMYTTNAIEALNSSFRKVTKKGSFPCEDAVLKALYLRLTELYKKMGQPPRPQLGYGAQPALHGLGDSAPYHEI